MPQTNRRFRSFDEFILGVTETIWEQRQVDTLLHYYADDIVVRSPAGLVTGNREVIRATRATLAEFPDRQLLGEDVIWSQTGPDSWLSSHRILSTATHAASGQYGKATGKSLTYRVIADCHAHADPEHGWQIDDEWLIRDQGAIVRQLGFSPREYAAAQIKQGGGLPFTPATDKPGPYRGHGNDEEPGPTYGSLLTDLMSSDTPPVSGNYDRACQFYGPGGGVAYGLDNVEQFWSGLRASFPDADFRIEHCLGVREVDRPPRASVRWSLEGLHDGDGHFGSPTGCDVFVMGFAHAEFGPRGILREYVLIDETAVWMQIILGQVAGSVAVE